MTTPGVVSGRIAPIMRRVVCAVASFPQPRLGTWLVVLGLAVSPAVAAAQDALGEPTDIEIPPMSASAAGVNQRPTWKGALEDSFRLLVIEHGWRIMLQPKTRRELGGPFFSDYVRSVRWPRQWSDGDPPLINYVGHPIHGAAAGRIWLDHVEIDRDPPIGMSRAYWASRARAAAWAAGYSVQFEIGVLSEASIGNVGMHPRQNGWVDHVVTPAGALALTIAEDALDRYFIEFVERKTGHRLLRLAVRVVFNPGRSLANITQGRTPWFRFTRPLD